MSGRWRQCYCCWCVDANGVIASVLKLGPNGAGKLKPNIVSLGVATTIAGTDGNPATLNGTSLANPNIAGLIACFWQAFPEFSNMTIIDAVQRSSGKYSNPDNRYGYGFLILKRHSPSWLQKVSKALLPTTIVLLLLPGAARMII